MAQPNLSKAIKELEAETGFVIFERNSKGAIPTKKGFEFLSYARMILEEMSHIKQLTDEENPDRQSFSISMPRASYIAEGFTRTALELDVLEQNGKISAESIKEYPFNSVEQNPVMKEWQGGVFKDAREEHEYLHVHYAGHGGH